MPYSTVVVGTDGSGTAEVAVKHAGKLAADHGARLVIVTAYEAQGGDDPVTKSPAVPGDTKWSVTDRSQAEEKARYGSALATELGATSIVAQAVSGTPPDVLLETAVDFDADVIVVGSKGLTGAS